MSGLFDWSPRALVLCALAAGLALTGCDDDGGSSGDAGFLFADAGVDSGPADAGTFLRPDGGPGMVCEEDATLGEFCSTDVECQDFCFCNGIEVCLGGVCARGREACDDGVACTLDSCDEASAECTNVADDGLCDDGNGCTGVEVCDGDVGCLPGIPINCSDGDSCTLDSCDPGETNPELACRNVLRDLDGDGFASISCEGGLDCDDDPLTGALINPNAVEICDDRVDNNCDGVADIFDTETCPPGNDLCDAPRVLTNSGVYPFATFDLSDDYDLECDQPGSQVDAVFEFTIPDLRDVRLELLSAAPDTSMELRQTECGDESEEPAVACEENGDAFGSSNLLIEERLEAGTYYVIVSTPDETFLTLDFRVMPPTPPPREDICDANTPLINATTSVSGDFNILQDDYPTIPCGDDATANNDAAYRLSLSQASNVEIVANGASNTGAQRDVRVQVVRDCDNAIGTQLACTNVDNIVPTGVEIIRFEPLPAGDYWILIEPDEQFVTTDLYSMAVDITVPPPRIDGDLCTTQQDITTMSVGLDVSFLRNDGGVSSACNSATASLPYRDGFWSFTVDVESDVTVTTTGPFHIVGLYENCSDLSVGELACGASSAGGVGTITQRLDPGTYSVVAAIPSNIGTITADVVITPVPAP
jgi:hypothetical protein